MELIGVLFVLGLLALILIGFVVLWAYDALFETFWSGRTPGKRQLGIRVLSDNGAPEGFAQAAVRNLLRIVDEYLTLWLAALISMVRSERTQRLGDIWRQESRSAVLVPTPVARRRWFLHPKRPIR